MSENNESSREVWQPPKRPDWVEKVNAEGRGLDIRSILPLDADELISTVIKKTGLSDFGPEDWREPFDILVRSLNDEADLNLIGRIMTRGDLLRTLEARLRIEDTYKRHPEIEAQVVEAPLIVIGGARTGTSALLNILAADPDNQATMVWETWFPCPPPEEATYYTDPRIEQADKRAMMWNRVTPEFATQHEVRGHVPTEDDFLHELSFRSGVMAWLGKTPSYLQWYATADMKPANEYLKRVLELLQWKHKRKRWVLKSPSFTVPLPLVFDTFPDAMVVYCHRDPARMVASAASIVNTVHWMRSDDYRAHQGLFASVTSEEAIAAATNRDIDLFESGALPKGRIFHMLYRDFVKDSVQTVRRIYAHFGITASAASFAAIQDFVARDAKAREKLGGHKYADLAPERLAKVRELFRRYQEYFAIPNEVG